LQQIMIQTALRSIMIRTFSACRAPQSAPDICSRRCTKLPCC
jgi:hypothetical protein